MSRSIIPVWAATLVAAVVVGIASGSAFLTWLPVVLAGAVLLTSVLQLALRRKEGLVTRMIVSIGGALVILAITSVVLVLVHPVTGFGAA
ncbi:hypothetical protein BH11ACT3_BH11ACT3_23960 [soil metagenome]